MEKEQDEFVDDEEDDKYPIEDRKIYPIPGEPQVSALFDKWKRGRLILQSDFQRRFVWDVKKSSLLIESALLGIPLPIIYLSEEQNSKEIVIDGQQRLTSFFSFIDGHFPDGRIFRLKNLKAFTNLKDLTFKDLDDTLQDKIRDCYLRTITFKKGSSPVLKFEIFERINSGSVSLNPQELRNCIYRGKYNELLKKLALNENFVALVGKEPLRDRMRNIELVLRFTAFYHATYLNYKPTMLRFLNEEMEKNNNVDEERLIELENAFKNTLALNKSLFGDNSFRRYYPGDDKNPLGHWSTKFNVSIYDVMMYTFAKEDKNKVYQNLDSIREALLDLMTSDHEFIESIEIGTSNLLYVRKRFDIWRTTLKNIIGIHQREPRVFARTIKDNLYKLNNTCAICGQKIIDIDDSAVDHIEQYWLGGKTIPENARLTHRYCNNSRSRNEGISNLVNNQSEPERRVGIFEISERGHRSPSGYSKIIVTLNWQKAGIERGIENIDEGDASKTLVRTLERIIQLLGPNILEPAIIHMSGKLPFLSRNPEEDYLRENGKKYSSNKIPNTDIYVLTHTNTPEKKNELEKFIEIIGLPSEFIDIEIVKK